MEVRFAQLLPLQRDSLTEVGKVTYDVVDLVDQHHVVYLEESDDQKAVDHARLYFSTENDQIGVYRDGHLIGTVS